MRESLAWLDSPVTAPAVPALLTGLVCDLRRTVMHPDLSLADQLAEVIAVLDRLAPPPGPGDSSRPAAAAVAARLNGGAEPATVLFERLSGEPVTMSLAVAADRELDAVERLQLLAPPGTKACQRKGELRTAVTGRLAARVFSLVVTDRLPDFAQRALNLTDVPLGKVLADAGVRRESLGVRVHGQVVESAARLWLGSTPVALAGERVPVSFCVEAEPGIGPG